MPTLFKHSLLLAVLLLTWTVQAQDSFETPQQTLDSYLQACREGDYQAADACYTKSSREFLEKHLKPEAKRDPKHLLASYERLKSLTFEEERVSPKRAILWADSEKVPPFLLRIQEPEEGWRIDYHFMSHYIKIEEDGWKWRNEKLFKIWKSRE